jgi:histone H3-like centromeric protein A
MLTPVINRGAPSAGRDDEPKRRKRPGVLALKEIRQYQRSHDMLIRKLPFSRVVKEICDRLSGGANPLRWRASAVEALQVYS